MLFFLNNFGVPVLSFYTVAPNFRTSQFGASNHQAKSRGFPRNTSISGIQVDPFLWHRNCEMVEFGPLIYGSTWWTEISICGPISDKCPNLILSSYLYNLFMDNLSEMDPENLLEATSLSMDPFLVGPVLWTTATDSWWMKHICYVLLPKSHFYWLQ